MVMQNRKVRCRKENSNVDNCMQNGKIKWPKNIKMALQYRWKNRKGNGSMNM